MTIIGDVKFFDNLNNVYIESEKAIYNDTTNTIITNGKTFIRVEDKYKFIHLIFYITEILKKYRVYWIQKF